MSRFADYLKANRSNIDVCIDFLTVAVLVCFAGIWAANQFLITPPYVSENKFPVRGIDISSHNGDIDFKEVASDNIDFVFIKATEGADFKDSKFIQNYNAARRNGLKTGAYHFFRFETDGVSQALNLLRTIGPRKLDIGIAIDVEKYGNKTGINPDSIAERLTSMIDFLNLCGHRVIFYSNREGYYDYIEPNFPGYPLWICGFTETPIQTEWIFWQYDHHGHVKGIKGDVDLNTFAGTRKDWENYINFSR